MDERKAAQQRIEAELTERGQVALPASLVYRLVTARSFEVTAVRDEIARYLGWVDA